MAAQDVTRARISIAEVSKLLGIPIPTLRSWERRYRLLVPKRSAGGHRRYSSGDVSRIRSMRDLIVRGRPAREAARAVRDRVRVEEAGDGDVRSVLEAGRSFDTFAVRRALDDIAGRIGVDRVVQDVALPALRAIGEEWKAGTCGVADEHFLTEQIRSWFARQAALAPRARRWGRVILACGPGETHTAGLDAFAALLARRGRRCITLGARTPATALEAAARTPDVLGVVVTCQRAVMRRGTVEAIRRVARVKGVTAFYAGHGFASQTSRARVPGLYLGEDLIEAADIVERAVAGSRRAAVSAGRRSR